MFCPQLAPENPAYLRTAFFFFPFFVPSSASSRSRLLGSHSSNTRVGKSFGCVATRYPSTLARGSFRCRRSVSAWCSPKPTYQNDWNGDVRSPSRPTWCFFFRALADSAAWALEAWASRRFATSALGVQ